MLHILHDFLAIFNYNIHIRYTGFRPFIETRTKQGHNMKISMNVELNLDYPEQELKNYADLAKRRKTQEVGKALLELVEVSRTKPLSELLEAFQKVRHLEAGDDRFTAFVGDTMHRLLNLAYALQSPIADVRFPSFCSALSVNALAPKNYAITQCDIVVSN